MPHGKPFRRSVFAFSLIGALCLGSVCHLWHHLTDPQCEATGRRGAQPCATCAALHGGSIVTAPKVAPLPDFSPSTEAPTTSFTAPAATVVRAAPPRGPPVA